MESIKPCNIASSAQQDRDIETAVAFICARAGVSLIGIQHGFGHAPDFVLFQPTVTTLVVPLTSFANPDEAIAAIKARLAQSGFVGGEK
jgi:hypothetical protein